MFWKKKAGDGQINIQNPMLVAVREESKDRTLGVHLDPAQLGTPGEAGIMLADIARRMAHVLAETGTESQDAALDKIATIFAAELATPTEGKAHQMG
ncbi:MAG: DUF5076 domain-containing protein [Pseudomonadota bacterium]